MDGVDHSQRNLAAFSVASAAFISFVFFSKRFRLFYLLRHSVDKNSSRNGGHIVADVLKAHKLDAVFTLCGGHISPILAACEKLGIRIVDTRHEATAAFAADAYSRIRRTVGVVAVTAGPGVTNVITAMKNAQMAESPVLLLGGAAATLLRGRGSLQDIDQMSLLRTICKSCTSVASVRDIAPALREAICLAQSGVPGPVYVELPIDVLYAYSMVSKEITSAPKGNSLMSKIVNLYLNFHLHKLFAGATEPQNVDPIPPHIPKVSDSFINTSAMLVKQSKRPVFVIGSQIVLPPSSLDDLTKALNRLGIPCFLSGMSRGLLGRNNPIHIRQRRGDALKEADLIVLAGSVCDFRLSYGRTLGRKAKIIAVNRGKSNCYKNSDLFWKPTHAGVGDPADFLIRLASQCSDFKSPIEWCTTLKDREIEKESQNSTKALKKTDKYLNPMKVLSLVEDLLEDNSIIVADGGDFVATASYIVRPRGPLQWLDPGPFGTLGVGAGFAIGAKVAKPNSQIWAIFGDGSFGYSAIEYDTFKRHSIPVMSIIGNDACWMQIAREQLPMLNTLIGCNLDYSNYHEIANTFGGHGQLVYSEEDIEKAISDSRDLIANGTPSIINFLIGKTDFRDGSISV